MDACTPRNTYTIDSSSLNYFDVMQFPHFFYLVQLELNRLNEYIRFSLLKKKLANKMEND